MSARVVNRLAFTEFQKIRSPLKLRRPKSPSAMSKEKIKRDLFGPVDRNDTRSYLLKELSKHQTQANQKWGFDFIAGIPARSPSSQYIWERVPPTIVPEMFTVCRAAHVREIPCDEDAERLMDARANACERYLNDSKTFATPVIASLSCGSINLRAKRTMQPKITDYLKERKRPSTNFVKRLATSTPTSPAKKLRRTVSLCETSTLKSKKSFL